MKNHSISILLAFLILLILTTACSSGSSITTTPATTSSIDGATLVQERCSVCHPLTYVERSRHTAADWQIIVNMMVSRGAQLTPEEEITVVNWLAANFGN